RERYNPGLIIIDTPFPRGGASVLKECRALWTMLKAIKRYRPNLICSFNAKPVIYSGFLLRALRFEVRSISVITGLGHAFIQGTYLRKAAGLGYKLSLNRAGNHTVFQNWDDRALFLNNGWADQRCSSLRIGSGVDVSRFTAESTINKEAKVVVMISRLLKQKGVIEFLVAARQVKQHFSGEVRFLLLGEKDEIHPDAIDSSLIDEAVEAGLIEYLGFTKDVVPYLQRADVFVLPSYREGVPRTVLEAASCGIPCVGADVPGTRECIRDGVTGFLVEVRSAAALADKVLLLLRDEVLRAEMGVEARKLMEADFDIAEITNKYLKLFSRIGDINVGA
ncbi:MAG: glycosyltransferase family 4 protein, partial [Gammaproteobacteria bacterium]|nr:glycosyltransferase family 4 protein [Gammaproteobacteria bacterium]